MAANISDDARTLLRTAVDILVEGRSPSGGMFTLPLSAAGEHTGIPPRSARYVNAVQELEFEGVISENPVARHMGRDAEYLLVCHIDEVLGP